MEKANWSKYFPAAITVTDENGIIVEMNDVSIAGYQKDGGADLIGTNAIECHKEPSLSKVKKLYVEHALNVYTITKNGKKKLVYQAPYFVEGKFSGMVEMSLPLPDELPHYDRDKK
jgi:transcriptional regulator with PAS, ATPase and Fis domain